MIPATIGASVYQLTIFVATMLASTLPEGSVSWLFYADRIAQFPVGIFSIALASVLLPALSHASANEDKVLFTTNLSNSLRYTNFVIIPMAAGLWVLALPITQLLFERGAFTAESSAQTSRALGALAAGLWGSSCYSMLVRAFIARKDTTTPTLIGVYSLTISLLASLVLMGPISQEVDTRLITALQALQSWTHDAIGTYWSLGHVGLALSSSIAAATSFLMLLAVFQRRYGGFPWRSFATSGLRSLTASLCMVAVLHLLLPLAPSPIIGTSLGCAIGALVYVLTCYLLRSAELYETTSLIRSRIRPA
jgi:putative peptidoglycan lipid II flippase